MVTIEEKARDFSHFKDTDEKEKAISYAVRRLSYDGFKAGAEWMIVKATAWIVKQGSKVNDGVVMICVEDFVKAMEE